MPNEIKSARDALEKCYEIALQWEADELAGVAGTTDKPEARSASEALLEIERLCKSALALPCRNCDVGMSDEQMERFNRFCVSHYNGPDGHGVIPSGCDCPCQGKDGCNAFVWEQMPYEADAQKGGEE